jgi:hypothetical protein
MGPASMGPAAALVRRRSSLPILFAVLAVVVSVAAIAVVRAVQAPATSPPRETVVISPTDPPATAPTGTAPSAYAADLAVAATPEGYRLTWTPTPPDIFRLSGRTYFQSVLVTNGDPTAEGSTPPAVAKTAGEVVIPTGDVPDTGGQPPCFEVVIVVDTTVLGRSPTICA